MTTFLDASALVKRYVEEDRSCVVREVFQVGVPVAISRQSIAEVATALCRRCRDGDLLPADRDAVLDALALDESTFHVVELTDDVTRESIQLLRRHPLRAGDAVQLASCVVLARELGTELRFVAFDDSLSRAARSEGLTVIA
ncbi:MAG TPA: type II toxin-antitoxin system VapC family toxin [Thermoanaerobaculia bacterium]|nr:type II toxin-antitoxin system VapC family toxin [Thermoanaerobaculia bacterium]